MLAEVGDELTRCRPARSRSCSPTSRARRACGRSTPRRCSGALARHDEILRDAIDAHGGHVVKTTGDGCTPRSRRGRRGRAPRIDAQRALGRRGRGTRPGRCASAWGSTPGDAEARDGDYFGTAVNRRRAHGVGARRPGRGVAGHRGAASATSRPTAASCVDLGEHRLRDLSRPERVFQVVRPGSPSTSRRCARSTRYAGNLRCSSRRSSAASESCDSDRGDASRRAARHAHRRRRRRQDAARAAGRGRGAARVPRRRVALRARGRRRRRRDGRRSSRPRSACSRARALSLDESIVEFLRHQAAAARARQLRAPARRRGALRRRRRCAPARRPRAGDQPRGSRGRRASRCGRCARCQSPTTRRPSSSWQRRGPALRRPRRAPARLRARRVERGAIAEICRRLDGIPLAIELAAARRARR